MQIYLNSIEKKNQKNSDAKPTLSYHEYLGDNEQCLICLFAALILFPLLSFSFQAPVFFFRDLHFSSALLFLKTK